jgi:putative DNA primase/helicase
MYTRGQWWGYNKGLWQAIHDLQMSSAVWNLLEDFERREFIRPTVQMKNSILDCLKSQFYVPEQLVDASHNLINLQNGVYNLDDGQLLPHRPEFYMTTQLPFEYDQYARTSMWQLYLLSTFTKPESHEYDPELTTFLQEAVGYSLTTSVDQHVIFLCYGEGANGKGVLFYVIEKLGGSSAVPLDLNQLHRERYQLADLAGKKIALCSEVSSTKNLVEDAPVKSLVSGDTMRVRQIYGEPFTLYPSAKLWWAMNELPPVADTSEGFWRRIRVLPFNQQFDDKSQIKDLKEQLGQELPGIFNWAMAGLKRLRVQGKFTDPAQIRGITSQYRKESNPVALFVEEMCLPDKEHPDPKAEIQSSKLYADYKEWCKTNTFQPHSSKNFKHEMQRLGFRHGKGQLCNVFFGISDVRTP